MYSFILLSCIYFSPVQGNTTGIYQTKNDFLTGNLTYHRSRLRTKSNPFLLRFPLSFDSDESLYLPQPDKSEKKIEPASSFGFVAKGITFIYNSDEKKYLSVLRDRLPVYFFLKEKVTYAGKVRRIIDILLYTQDLDAPTKEFTTENIEHDFADKKALFDKLLKLREAIRKKQFRTGVGREVFFEYQKLIKNMLN